MPLPKLNVPVYETILPSTDKVIKFRPFLVKEEKILLTALKMVAQGAMMNAIKDIVKNCVQEEIDVNKLPMFDLEYLFLKLRSKSVGEETEIGLVCPNCSETTPVNINMDKVSVIKPEGHTNKIFITDDIGVVMSYPNLTTAGVAEEDGMKIVKECIEMIFTNEETHEKDTMSSKELDDFLDSMDTKQFSKIRHFFETMPKLQHEVKYSCVKCGEEQKVTLQGLDSFSG